MHIAIAFDENYLTPFYVLLTSIFYNNLNEKISFHCITSGINDLEKEKIMSYVTENKANICFYEVNLDTLEIFSETLNNSWTLAAYYKIFFPQIVPSELERLLYIDTDTLVLNSLTELYYEELDDFPLAAVYDSYVKSRPELGILEENNYFNSGVLLFNLPVWRNQKISEETIKFLHSYPEKIKFVDQDALNVVLINNWKKLPEKYNLIYSYLPQDTSKKKLNQFVKNKVILHFTLQRPWHFLCKNRLRYLYKFYLKKSPKRKEKLIIDFTFAKLPAFFKQRLIEWYIDNPFIQKIWRKIKL